MPERALRRRVDGLMVRHVVEDTLLLDVETGYIHQLNETAGFIWRHCDSAPSVDELAQLLVNEFEVGHDIALKDVSEALGCMRALNLVIDA